MDTKDYWLWLCGSGVSRQKIRKITEQYGTVRTFFQLEKKRFFADRILNAEEKERLWQRKKEKRYVEESEQMQKEGIEFLYPEHPDYPIRLKRLSDYPYSLYVRGEIPPDRQPAAGIVGSRTCSNYGRNMAKEISRQAAAAGIGIISGMARGIDTCAHLGALSGRGKTWAILGCGIDICYPKENRELYDRICEHGGILTEYPPGTPPLPILFPQRNRLISGLSDAVVVVEAREKSGSLITVEFALEQGKDIYAVPGRIGDALNAGCNRLIQNGAGILTEPADLPRVFGAGCRNEPAETLPEFGENKYLEQLYNLIKDIPQSFDALREQMGLSPEQMFPLLLQLQLSGQIRELGKGCYART